MKTVPLKQWEVARELRRRLKHRFDEEAIEIPFPHQTVYWGAGQSPGEMALLGAASAAAIPRKRPPVDASETTPDDQEDGDDSAM